MPYLDHAATTPMLGEVITAMTAAMADVGNPSSLHTAGRRARRTVEESREKLAAALGARPSEAARRATVCSRERKERSRSGVGRASSWEASWEWQSASAWQTSERQTAPQLRPLCEGE